jgi:hypothetical protein
MTIQLRGASEVTHSRKGIPDQGLIKILKTILPPPGGTVGVQEAPPFVETSTFPFSVAA